MRTRTIRVSAKIILQPLGNENETMPTG